MFQDILCATVVWLARNIAALFPPPSFQNWAGNGANVQLHWIQLYISLVPRIVLSFHKKEPECIYTQELYLHLAVSKSV